MSSGKQEKASLFPFGFEAIAGFDSRQVASLRGEKVLFDFASWLS